MLTSHFIWNDARMPNPTAASTKPSLSHPRSHAPTNAGETCAVAKSHMLYSGSSATHALMRGSVAERSAK